MALEFRTPLVPHYVGQLTSMQCEQLVIVGKRYDSRDRSAEARLRDEPIPDDAPDWMDWDDGNLAAHGLVFHTAWEDGELLYDVWVHHSRDSGCVFKAGTTDVIAGRFQDTWMDENGRSPLDVALHKAEAAAK